ncbi:uncharacterized protein LOC111401589 isoform X2 [Olea europaea var. sylvestris]|uniref:uncharacterized protein LOC111401589 isoform X2 n=1 Tax=Olea europaea var. sylvestris TaxID=158386 RepID=UPI000C1D7019|nr:uncharacterized protein LOC111401589 isoform X2 [Olea europaea var. sylvestris]
MTDEQACQMDGCCYICGDIGFAEALVTCSHCKEINEHLYCMQMYFEKYPTEWYCDECEHRAVSVSTASCPRGDLPRGSKLINFGTVRHDATPSLTSRKLSNETRQGSVNLEKKVATRSTKYIPVTEAIKLSSGAPKSLSPKKVTRHTIPPQLKTEVNLLGRTSIKPQTIPVKFSAYLDKAKFASGPSQKLKPQKHGNVEISWRQQQSKELRVNVIQAAPTPIHEHVQKERTAEIVNAIKKLSPTSLPSASRPVVISGSDGCPNVEPGISNAENVNDSILPDVEPRTSDDENANNGIRPDVEPKISNTSKVLPNVEPRMTNAENVNSSILHFVEPRTSNAENLNSSILPYAEPRTSSAANVNNILPYVEPRASTVDNMNNSILPYVEVSTSNPAIRTVWMGSFSIHNGFRHWTLSDPIQAHPPGKVHRKVYEFSMLLPEVLHFELFPCRELWMNLFQAYCPDGKNIGLYFFPSNSERSKDYFSLLVSMIEKDLALRKQIADVELLLFASTRLSLDCQRWKGNYFIWGFFRREKRDDTACQDRSLTLDERPSDDVCGSFDGDNNEVIDMEIDMIGGKDVGQTDIFVRRGEQGGSSKESTTAASHVDSIKGGPAFDVKSVKLEDYPPGFAQAYLQRVWSSRAH